MPAILLHSGKTEQFRALGETGQPVYHSALQLRKVISRRLPGKERHLAIPQRDQQGEGADWYSDIEGDVIPWSSATEGEREDARIQLEAFRQDIIALRHSPHEGQSGDHEVFNRLVKWVCHFPDEGFVYLVNGTPVLTFWGFIHPDADRHANPLLCLYPSALPEETAPPPLSAPIAPLDTALEPEPRPAPVASVRPWWRRWWWLLPLLLGLLLLLLLFGLRACSSPGAPTLATPSLDARTPDATLPRMQHGWDFWPFKSLSGGSLPGQRLTAPNPTSSGLDGDPTLPAIGGRTPALGTPGLPSPESSMPDDSTLGVDLQASADQRVAPFAEGLPLVGDMPTPPALPDGFIPPTLEPLTLPANAPDGTADFLNGNWRGAGVMDSQTGRPLQVTYTFEQGNGAMYIQRGGSSGMTCAGPVSATMQDGNLQVEGQERARCEDGSHYEMPRVQCHQADGETATCAASYDDEPFPMQLRKAS
ncbi:SrfA family protein [Billgrantia aerodenitrificans]|uniref:Breakpoint cluster region protein n=1 Tax=Billgrantia aerodenitrificans TaxID=2733483 RepID=A0ABS9AV69_9GAMM|nr:hypothetical protein [Halomonas aerodenitrificans]